MNSISRLTLVVCLLFLGAVAFFYYPKWTKGGTEATLSWDVSGYYLYLPALFLYGDIEQLGFLDDIIDRYGPTPEVQQAYRHEASGNFVMKYSAGQALLMSPFFAVGHAWASRSDAYPADGFSFPYQKSIGVGMLLYALLGLVVLRMVLLRYFQDRTVAVVLVALVFGSNYLNFAAIDHAMTHNPLFTIYALILLLGISFYERPGLGRATGLGLLCGLATLVRPTEIISVLLPLLWGISNGAGLRRRIAFFQARPALLLAAGLAFAAVVALQPIYWKWVTGEWVVYSYQDQGFSWLRPHVWDFTLSYHSGWLRYCPMMVLALLGLVPFVLRRENVWPVVAFCALNVYIITAWDVWDFGGSSGRAMVQSYPVLAFPLAALVGWCHRRRWTLALFYPLFLGLIYLNIWWTHHAHRGAVQALGVTKAYYWATLGRWSADRYDRQLLDNTVVFRGDPEDYQVLYSNNFQQDSSDNRILVDSVNQVIRVGGNHPEVAAYTFPRPTPGHAWIRAFADVEMNRMVWNIWGSGIVQLRFLQGDETVGVHFIRLARYLNQGQRDTLFLDARPPSGDWDRIVLEVYCPEGNMVVTVHSLGVIGFG